MHNVEKDNSLFKKFPFNRTKSQCTILKNADMKVLLNTQKE